MPKTPQVAFRVDPELYAAYRDKVREMGSTVTADFEKHMSEVTGRPITRVRSRGLNTRERVLYGVTEGLGEKSAPDA